MRLNIHTTKSMKNMYEQKRVVVVMVNYRHGWLLILGNIHVVTEERPLLAWDFLK
jgi:hypothetical protein